MDVRQLFDQQDGSPFQHINDAVAFLTIVSTLQSVDGMTAPCNPPEYADLTKLLLDAGFIRKISVPDNAFPYRITWKGLQFQKLGSLYFDKPESEVSEFAKVSLLSFF